MNSMARAAVLPIKTLGTEVSVFSDKASLIVFWLLSNHDLAHKEGFSVNELSRTTDTSIGLAHKVIKQLEYDGIISAKGFRTNKKFYLKSPKNLLLAWIKAYNLIKKTKTKGFAYSQPQKTEDSLALQKNELVPALHTAAAEIFRAKTTNVNTKEYYLLDWDKLPKVTRALHLEELDRGYELLIIKPYYGALLSRVLDPIRKKDWIKSFAILTFLDLYHFPLRGIEQAEALFRKTDFLKSICSWSEVENAHR